MCAWAWHHSRGFHLHHPGSKVGAAVFFLWKFFEMCYFLFISTLKILRDQVVGLGTICWHNFEHIVEHNSTVGILKQCFFLAGNHIVIVITSTVFVVHCPVCAWLHFTTTS